MDFTIIARDSAGPRWCKVSIQVDRHPIFRYICENHQAPAMGLKVLSPLGKEVDADTTHVLSGTLKDLMDELKKKILDIQSENFSKSGPLSLQGTMLYQVGASGQDTGSLQLGFRGQNLVSFHVEKYTVTVHSEDRAMGQQWKEATEVTDLLKKIFPGDLKRLIDSISEKLPQTTAAPSIAPDTVTAPPNATAPPDSALGHLVLIICLSVLAVMVAFSYCCYYCFKEMLQKEKSSSNSTQKEKSSSNSTPQTGSASVSNHSSAEMLSLCIQKVPSPAEGADGSGDEASCPLGPSSAHSDP